MQSPDFAPLQSSMRREALTLQQLNNLLICPPAATPDRLPMANVENYWLTSSDDSDLIEYLNQNGTSEAEEWNDFDGHSTEDLLTVMNEDLPATEYRTSEVNSPIILPWDESTPAPRYQSSLILSDYEDQRSNSINCDNQNQSDHLIVLGVELETLSSRDSFELGQTNLHSDFMSPLRVPQSNPQFETNRKVLSPRQALAKKCALIHRRLLNQRRALLKRRTRIYRRVLIKQPNLIKACHPKKPAPSISRSILSSLSTPAKKSGKDIKITQQQRICDKDNDRTTFQHKTEHRKRNESSSNVNGKTSKSIFERLSQQLAAMEREVFEMRKAPPDTPYVHFGDYLSVFSGPLTVSQLLDASFFMIDTNVVLTRGIRCHPQLIELALVRFSLRRGILNCWHEMVSPVAPSGHFYSVGMSMLRFLNKAEWPDPVRVVLTPKFKKYTFAKHDQHHHNQLVLKRIQSHCPEHDPPLLWQCKVRDLLLLAGHFAELLINPVTDEEISQRILFDKHDSVDGINCQHHEDDENWRCALGSAKRWVYGFINLIMPMFTAEDRHNRTDASGQTPDTAISTPSPLFDFDLFGPNNELLEFN